MAKSELTVKVRELMATYGISQVTAYRWVKCDVEVCIKIHLENKQLRDDCERNGIPLKVGYARRQAGWPLEECGTRQMQQARRVATKALGQSKLVDWIDAHGGECTVDQAMEVMRWGRVSAHSTLSRWSADGTLVRVRPGVYAPARRLTEAAE